MIIRAKIKGKDWQEGDEVEFRGKDAIDQVIRFLAAKYGTMNINIS